jgi:hypothetical protein
MRHAYRTDCRCERCVKEGARRSRQAHAKPIAYWRGRAVRERQATREEQHARYLDCGPQNWDDK